MKLLFVCTGNLYRSQAAEAIAKKLGIEARSAGCSENCNGKKVPKFFRKLLRKKGYPVGKDAKSKPLALEDISWADFVMYMQPSHLEFLEERFLAEEKFKFLGNYLEEDLRRIPDVAFQRKKALRVIRMIERCIKNFISSKGRIHTIINVRGTSGSGKSSAVRKIIKKYPSRPLYADGRIFAHRVERESPLFVIGPYKTSCSGCDRMPTQDSITHAVRRLSRIGDVIFEGFFVSQITGRYAELARSLPEVRFIFGFIDTPLKKALRRLRKRRLKTGITKPLKTKHIISHHKTVGRIRRKLEKQQFLVRTLPHKSATKTLLNWLDEEVRRFPR